MPHCHFCNKQLTKCMWSYEGRTKEYLLTTEIRLIVTRFIMTYLLFILPLETHCSYPRNVIAIATCMVQYTDMHMGTHTHMAESKSFLRYLYGLPHTHMGHPMRVWAEYLYGSERQ